MMPSKASPARVRRHFKALSRDRRSAAVAIAEFPKRIMVAGL